MALSSLWMGSVQHSLSGVFHSRGTGLLASVYRYILSIQVGIDLDLFPRNQQLETQ